MNNNDETVNEFVADLIANNEFAWKHFIDQYNKYFAWNRKHLNAFKLSVDELVHETYIYLTENDFKRLRKFQKDGKSFNGFVYSTIRAAKSRLLYGPTKIRDHEVSDSDRIFPHINKNDDKLLKKFRQKQQRALLNHAFLLLWQSNSQRAYIYMLRRKLELSSKQVANLLDIKVNNVDVTLKRAEHELKNILEEMDATNDILFN